MALAASLRASFSSTYVADGVTFADVVERYQDEVFGVALRILGDREVASGVTNTVFVKAYRGFHPYETTRPLRNWLIGIAVHEAISAGRVATRERARRAPLEATDSLEGGPAPEQEALWREERARIHAAVAALPELYRVPIVLRYFNDLSLEEIASLTGRRAPTIAVQLLRGRALLRAALQGGAE